MLSLQAGVRKYLIKQTDGFVRLEVVDCLITAAGARSKSWLDKLKTVPRFRNVALKAIGSKMKVGALEIEWLKDLLEDEAGELDQWV